MPDMRRVTSRGGDSTVHLLNLAVADSTYANKDSRDSMNCSFRDSNLSPGEPKKHRVSERKLSINKRKGQSMSHTRE
jgi:hypothetical protein